MSMLLIRYDICDCGVAKWYYSIPDLTHILKKHKVVNIWVWF